jgi:anti-sigma factor RsiW
MKMHCPTCGTLSRLVDGELGRMMIARVTAHAQACKACWRKLVEYRRAAALFLAAAFSAPGPRAGTRPDAAEPILIGRCLDRLCLATVPAGAGAPRRALRMSPRARLSS